MNHVDKQSLRQEARAARSAQPDKELVSQAILEQALALAEYRAAHAVLFYVDVRDEVRTRSAIRTALSSRKSVSVPFCVGNELELFRLTDWGQLVPGRYGILEPREDVRREPVHQVDRERIEVVFTPGVAFDYQCSRYGHGQGYYDRLLATLPSSATLLGLAYDCQVYPQLPTESHDVVMHKVVTQSTIYQRPH